MLGKSAEVTTALTPGSASALSTLIDRMRAWACGLRLILPHSMPGMTISAPKFARQDRKSTRLNSSHLGTSSAALLLDKKKDRTAFDVSSRSTPTRAQTNPPQSDAH